MTLQHLRELGRKIKILREEHRLSQAALGRYCNLSQKEISHYERSYRTPSIEVLSKIAEKLGTTAGDLMGTPEKRTADPELSKVIIWKIVERLEKLDQDSQKDVLRYVERKLAAMQGREAPPHSPDTAPAGG